jgi:hypothetical protein
MHIVDGQRDARYARQYAYRQRKKQAGLCVACPLPRGEGDRLYCVACRRRYRAYQKAHSRRKRQPGYEPVRRLVVRTAPRGEPPHDPERTTCRRCGGLLVCETEGYEDGMLTEWRCLMCARRTGGVVRYRYGRYRRDEATARGRRGRYV